MVADVRPEMSRRWQGFLSRANLRDAASSTFDQLASAYQSPERHYHNLNHIHHCLSELETVASACPTPVEVEAAIWFHDYVYDARRNDNETQSSSAAASMLQMMGMEPASLSIVSELILDTRHKVIPKTAAGTFVVDIDLSILGRPVDEFDAYERGIRAEYAHVDDLAFRQGRSTILSAFLARPTIYATKQFRERYESSARVNLQRSLERLSS